MSHFSPHSMVPVQFCYQFYACLLVVALFGGVSVLAIALMTLYGIGGVELVFTLCFLCFYGLIRLLLPPWYANRESMFSQQQFEFEKMQLAIETYKLEEKEEVIASCSCCPICLHDFSEGDTLTMSVICGHVFHKDCLDMWLPKSASCPYCRQDLKRRCENGDPSNINKNGAWGIFDGVFDSVYA